MRFIHLADLHIGKVVKDFGMLDDQRFIFNQIIDVIQKKKADAVLISGDIYDRAIPPEEAVRLFDDFIFRLSELKVKVFLISGNHDSDERLNFGSRLFAEKDVYFCTKFNGSLYEKTVEDEFGKVHFYLMPFVKASQVRHFYPEDKIENYDQAVRRIIEHAGIDPKERNVILAHQFVAGTSEKIVLSGSESPAVANVGLVEQIGCDCFDPFDYAALGHIHKAQRIGRDEVRYAGTLLKYHADEVHDEKSFPIVTLGEKGEVEIELYKIKPLRDMRSIKGPIKELLSEENIKDAEDYMFVTLTDEDIVTDAMTIFRQTYPNTMQIRYENSHTREMAAADPAEIVEMRSFPELVSDFYQAMYGAEISEEEMKVLKETAGKAGVYHEAG